jgi:hypothetical protein
VRFVPLLVTTLVLGACSRQYHPEYHPETSYSYVQNVTYAQNVSYGVSLGDAMQGAAIAYPTSSNVAKASPGPVGAVVVYGNVNGNIVVGR